MITLKTTLAFIKSSRTAVNPAHVLQYLLENYFLKTGWCGMFSAGRHNLFARQLENKLAPFIAANEFDNTLFSTMLVEQLNLINTDKLNLLGNFAECLRVFLVIYPQYRVGLNPLLISRLSPFPIIFNMHQYINQILNNIESVDNIEEVEKKMRIFASLSVDKYSLSKNLRLKMIKILSQCVLGNYEFQPAIPDNEEQLASVEVVEVLKFPLGNLLQYEAACVLAKYVTELSDQVRRQATFAMLALLEHQIQSMQTPFAVDILYEFAPAIPTDLIPLMIKKLIALIKSENYVFQKEVANIFIRLSWRLHADQALEIALGLNYIMDRGDVNYCACFNAMEAISNYIDSEKKHELIVDIMNSIYIRHANLDAQLYLIKRLISLTQHIQVKTLTIVVEKLFATLELANDQDDDIIPSAFKHFAQFMVTDDLKKYAVNRAHMLLDSRNYFKRICGCKIISYLAGYMPELITQDILSKIFLQMHNDKYAAKMIYCFSFARIHLLSISPTINMDSIIDLLLTDDPTTREEFTAFLLKKVVDMNVAQRSTLIIELIKLVNGKNADAASLLGKLANFIPEELRGMAVLAILEYRGYHLSQALRLLGELANCVSNDFLPEVLKALSEGVGDVACTAIGCYANRIHLDARIKFIKKASSYQAENVADILVKLATNGVLEEEKIFLRPYLMLAYQSLPEHAGVLAGLVEDAGAIPPREMPSLRA